MASIIGKRYGNAVFELARDGGWIDTLETEVALVKDAFISDEMKNFLSHPNISMEEKLSAIENALNGKVRDELIGLFCLVVKKGRMTYLDDVFEEIEESVDKYNGKAKVYVKSAYELSELEKSNLAARIGELTGHVVVPIYEVDETLIGGLVIRIGDKVVDSSIKGHLSSMRRSLLDGKAV